VFEAATWIKSMYYDKIMIENQKKEMEIDKMFTRISI